MKNIVFYTLASLFAHATLFAQKHDYVWLSGPSNANYQLDFNHLPPKLSSVAINYYFAANKLSVANQDGVLDFYSNGCDIRNRAHQILENGQTFNYDSTYKKYCERAGYYPARKGLFAFPNVSGYSFFYTSVDYKSSKCFVQDFLVAQIDMSQNNGLGKVLWKDSVLLKDACLQDVSATRHANGRDWWILLGSNNAPLYYRFLYQPGISIQGPWTQYIENPLLDDYYYNGWSSFSPDGSKYASMMNRAGLALYDFDRCTGLLSNMRFAKGIEGSPNTPTLAFSPNSRYIYRTWQQGETLAQYDTWADTLEKSLIIVSNPVKWIFQGIQSAPDGKIYVWCGSTDSCASVVHFPDRKGKDCRTIEKDLRLPKNAFTISQYYPNYRLGPIDGSVCDTLNIDNLPKALWRHDIEDAQHPLQITFTDLSYYEPREWQWDFGDGGSSQDTSPVHTYTQAGSYKVCLVVKNQYASDTLCKTITVGSSDTGEPLATRPPVSLFPNSADNYLEVSMDMALNAEPVAFTLSNAIGVSQLESQLFSKVTRVGTAHLLPGIYFARAERGGKILFVKPIVIQH